MKVIIRNSLVICAVLSALVIARLSVANSLPKQLNNQCPPSFEKVESGVCLLRSLYDFYDSPKQHGGFRVNLPTLEKAYTAEQIDLGRYLFFDPLLSKEQDLSCASCHQLDKSLSDGRKRSISAADEQGKRGELTRGTPTLWNIAFHSQFMWDGRAHSLEEQASLPLFSDVEMANTPENLVTTISQNVLYIDWFNQAFNEKPTVENISKALAAFQTTLISLNSRYDRYVHGDTKALNEQEIRGYNAFRGFVARCSQCHVPPLFTDGELAVIGSPQAKGLAPDEGAMAWTKNPEQLSAFRVPTLRNIQKSAPYFHAGQFDDLSQVVEFYNNTRGHMAPKGQKLSIHWHVHMTKGSKLSRQDEQDIVAFLSSLTDETMLPIQPLSVPSGIDINTKKVIK